MQYARLATVLGQLTIVTDDDGAVYRITTREEFDVGDAVADGPATAQAVRQVREYLAGERMAFELATVVVGTEFQHRVWEVVRTIPYGHVTTYGDVAEILGNRRAARAVGAALSRNPLLLITPCHRVVGASGRLTGFSAGVGSKDWLLAHERGGLELPTGQTQASDWDNGRMRVHIATDHAAFECKNYLVERLTEAGYDVVDHGAETYDELDDYPTYVIPCAQAVVADGTLGIVLGGSGNGEQMAANKVRGVRAALAYSTEIARLAREHNDANIVSLGGRMQSEEESWQIVKTFLETPFSGADRHQRRVDLISAYEASH